MIPKYSFASLQTECGSAFTSKLEGMFKDIDLSRDLMATYSQHLKTKLDDRTVFTLDRSRDMDLHVQVRYLSSICSLLHRSIPSLGFLTAFLLASTYIRAFFGSARLYDAIAAYLDVRANV